MTDQLPPPPASLRSPAQSPGQKRRGRPAFGAVIGFAVLFRGGREIVERFAFSRYGFLGVILTGAAVIALMLAWRADQRRRARKVGGTEFTPEVVARQLADSEVGPPAFPEDGTLLGASLLVVNQRSKVLEVNTEYDLFGSAAQPIGAVRQIGQSQTKQIARIFTFLDQYFTHHFEVQDTDGRPVLRLTRPRKIFLSKVHVFDGQDRYIGTIRQANIFWKIRFQLLDAAGNVVGGMQAENVRAWDFHIYDAYGHKVATVVKSWEGWARTAFTRADRYVVRIHEPLPYPLRHLTLATALTVDLALKQDARGIS